MKNILKHITLSYLFYLILSSIPVHAMDWKLEESMEGRPRKILNTEDPLTEAVDEAAYLALLEEYKKTLGQTEGLENNKYVEGNFPREQSTLHWRAFSDAFAVDNGAQSLWIDISNAQDQSLIYFARALAKNNCIKSLTTHLIELSDEVGQAFVDAVNSNETLEHFGAGEVDVLIFNKEINELIYNKLLRNKFNNAINRDDATVKFSILEEKDEMIVAKIVAEHTYLKSLELPIWLGEEALIALLESLSKNKTLENLILVPRGKLTNKACEAIAQTIKMNRSLKHISLRTNFTLDGFETVVAGMKSNFTLIKLSLAEPSFHNYGEYKDTYARFEAIIKRNRFLSPILDKCGYNFIVCLIEQDLTVNKVMLLPELKKMMIQNYLTALLLDNPELQPKKPE